MTHNVTCNRCGREFTARRSDAKLCGPMCRTAAHREAKKGPRPKFSLSDRLSNRTRDLLALTDKIEVLTKDERFPAWAKSKYGPGRRESIRRHVDRLTKTLDEWPEPSQRNGLETVTETPLNAPERIVLP